MSLWRAYEERVVVVRNPDACSPAYRSGGISMGKCGTRQSRLRKEIGAGIRRFWQCLLDATADRRCASKAENRRRHDPSVDEFIIRRSNSYEQAKSLEDTDSKLLRLVIGLALQIDIWPCADNSKAPMTLQRLRMVQYLTALTPYAAPIITFRSSVQM